MRRALGQAEQRCHEIPRVVIVAESGTDDKRMALLCLLLDRIKDPMAARPEIALGQERESRLGHDRCDCGDQRAMDREVDDPGACPPGRHRAESRGADVPGRAGDDKKSADAPLVCAGRSPGQDPDRIVSPKLADRHACVSHCSPVSISIDSGSISARNPTTKAIASVRECVSDTSKSVMPSNLARSAAVPCRTTMFLPRRFDTTSISRHLIPRIPVPSAFEMASLAANRAANSEMRVR